MTPYSSLDVDSGTALIDSVSRFSEPAWQVFLNDSFKQLAHLNPSIREID